MSGNRNKIKFLVADTSAFINAVPLNDYAENVLTVPDVLEEVRNKRQIRRLCVLPFDLQVREPCTESIKHCVEFAKKTGDYASLSGIDIKVIALTYELEAASVGTEHLRTEPVVSQVVASKEKPEEMKDDFKMPGWYMPNCNNGSDEESDDSETSIDVEQNDIDHSDDHVDQIDHVKNTIEQQLLNNITCAREVMVDKDTVDEITEGEVGKLIEQLKNETISEKLGDICDDILVKQRTDTSSSEDDDEHLGMAETEQNDDGWITPANIKKVKKSLEGRVEDKFVPEVACMSTDYALQNVLKQINLNVAALNGRVIKHLRTYILRCYACFKTTSIMTKVFCPNCGNKTLKRVAVSLNENGEQIIHINTRRPLTSKYKNQSLPRFQGGKHSRNPILFEDQPIPRQMPSRVAKTKTNALNEDYIAGFSAFAMRDVDSKSAMLRAKGNIKEWARNNTFEEDRRRKNYNRLYK